MSILNENWSPEFGTIFTWIAMDREGKIAVMVNNCFGNLPLQLLRMNNVELLLDQLNEYVWEESQIFFSYPENKNGGFHIDLYSAWRYAHFGREYIANTFQSDLVKLGHYSEANLAANKGFFVYHGVEGSFEGEDYPVGYNGKTKMGDYFRFLVPTLYASIEDFPKELHHGIVVSDTVDFSTDQLLDNDKINSYFSCLPRPSVQTRE